MLTSDPDISWKVFIASGFVKLIVELNNRSYEQLFIKGPRLSREFPRKSPLVENQGAVGDARRVRRRAD
jgi:hypothetical protein